MTTTERLVVELAGEIPAGWAGVISAVDRAAFVPARVWVYEEDNEPRPLDRDTDPQRWRRVVYSDTAIMTQFDNGATVWPDATGEHPTSSASQPSLMLAMLTALDVRAGHRVLEIGTGTGCHAALLTARLGDDAVTSIEIDATVAQQARANLTAADYTPAVITGDGATGYRAAHRMTGSSPPRRYDLVSCPTPGSPRPGPAGSSSLPGDRTTTTASWRA